MLKDIRAIKLEEIVVGEYEQRASYEDVDIENIAASIKRIGLIYPIVVSEEGGKFSLVEGHRRFLAYKKLGKTHIPCVIITSKESGLREIAFAGNFFRKDLSAIELAGSIKDALDHGGMSIEQIAEGFNKKPDWVRRMVAILTWPADVQVAVHERVMSVSAAANLALIPDDTYRAFLIENAVLGGVTARTTASWLQAYGAMQTVEEAITSEPVGPGSSRAPAVPQTPCFCCVQQFPVDQVSHVPVCSACIQILRKIGGV